jgi:Zn-finger protein
MKCTPVKAGEWVQPKRRGYLMQCCDCGLIHKLNFRLVKSGKGNTIQFQAFRYNHLKGKKYR